MTEYLNAVEATVTAALYLRQSASAAPVPRRNWPEILAALRCEDPTLETCAAALRRRSLFDAAAFLDGSNRLAVAEELVCEGRCLSIADSRYPKRWIEVLGRSAPPALWSMGPLDVLSHRPFASVVGCRDISPRVERFAYGSGQAIAHREAVLLSGGARGCDSAAERGCVRGGGYAVRIVAHGLRLNRETSSVLQLSVCPPLETFSTANAMERNTLIYAGSDRTLVVQSRFREGGTWHGAVNAMRRRLTCVYFRESPEAWAKAFIAMGARPVTSPEEFLAAEPRTPALL